MSEYIKDECFHDSIVKLKTFLEKYKDVENLEVEFRLGYLDSDEFKTDIGKEFFDKITTQLADSEILDDIIYEKSEDYFYSGKRLMITDDNPEGTCIKKEKIAVLDFIFSGSGFDLRVSFSKENPDKRFPKEKAVYKRLKERTSYIYKNLSYDLTKVTTNDNTVEDNSYEIELEIKNLDLKKANSHYIIHDCLLKIKDMIEMCEELDEDSKVQFVKEKVY
jgi:hypothetical protein